MRVFIMNFEQLVEQNIIKHESHLKHVDELLEQADQGVGTSGPTEIEAQLAELRQERDQLASELDDYKNKSAEYAKQADAEKLGPMIIWEKVAERLEKLVEHIKH
jgi:uncharacterized coiled-coil DUF342 family protein